MIAEFLIVEIQINDRAFIMSVRVEQSVEGSAVRDHCRKNWRIGRIKLGKIIADTLLAKKNEFEKQHKHYLWFKAPQLLFYGFIIAPCSLIFRNRKNGTSIK